MKKTKIICPVCRATIEIWFSENMAKHTFAFCHKGAGHVVDLDIPPFNPDAKSKFGVEDAIKNIEEGLKGPEEAK